MNLYEINNRTNADGQGVLHIAATEGQLECIKILLELNCDTTIKDVRGQTALDLARLWGHRTCAKYLSNDLWNVNKLSIYIIIHILTNNYNLAY